VSGALEVAAIGMQVQQRALDAIANNISNVNTPAFKRSDLRFAELVSVQPAGGGTGAAAALDPLAGVALSALPLLDRQGKVERTGDARHIAIDGAGFIELMGPEGRTQLWRGGTLKVLDDGALATAGGIPLKAGIQVPAEASELRIDRGGKVFAVQPGAAGEVELGTIMLVKLGDAAQVERVEGGVYSLVDEATVVAAPPGEDGMGELIQAALERSNVDLNGEMVSLMIAQRAYAANAQVVRAADEFYSVANSLRR
jgi:flagellar basal-body rod protein FlgG